MRTSNTIGVDLAKNVIQVSVVTSGNKELSNKELSRGKFAEFLAKQKPGLIAFEACATAHHWARLATTYGHQVKIIIVGIKVVGVIIVEEYVHGNFKSCPYHIVQTSWNGRR